MPFRDQSPGAMGMAKLAAAPVNAFYDARDQQKRNSILDLQAQRMQGQMDDDAEWDAAYATKDWDTLRRLDPETTELLAAHEQQQQMSGLGDIPVSQNRIDMGDIQKRGMDERKFAADQRNDQRNYNLDVAQERRMSQPEPAKPADMGPKISPKDANTARVKLTQVSVARRQLQEAKNKYTELKGTLSAGPGGSLIPSPKGKAYDAAIDTMRSSISALTRVPGIGAMSDFETRLDQAKFPNRGNYEEVGQQQLQALEDQLDTIEQSYREMLGGAPAAPKTDDFPSAVENKGRRIKDKDTGKIFKSDGSTWVPE